MTTSLDFRGLVPVVSDRLKRLVLSGGVDDGPAMAVPKSPRLLPLRTPYLSEVSVESAVLGSGRG